MENGKQRSRSSRKMLEELQDQDFFSQYNDDKKSNKSKGSPRKRDQKLADKVS